MSKTVTLSFLYNEEFFLKSTKKVYDYELKTSNKKYIGWLFLALLQFAIVGALKHNAYGLLYLSTVFLLYWYLLRWQLRKYLALKWFNKLPIKNTTIDVTIDKEGITSNLYSEKLYFNAIDFYVKLDDGVLLLHDGVASLFLSTQFKDEEDYNLFLEWLLVVNKL